MLCCATVCLIAERVILILPVACEHAATLRHAWLQRAHGCCFYLTFLPQYD